MQTLYPNVIAYTVYIVITEKHNQLVVFPHVYTFNTKVLLLTLFAVVLEVIDFIY